MFKAYWIAFIASLGGFLQSYVTCVIAGALIFITSEFQLSPFNQGNVAAIILLGALAGSLTAGYLADRIGRRMTLFLSALIFLITAVSVFMIKALAMLMMLRFATGIAIGMTSILVPMYLAEIAPPSKRGAFVTFFQLSVTIGTLIAYFVNLMLAKQGNWRMMFFFAAIPAAFQIFGFLFFPESPRWLLKKGRMSEAKKVLAQIGGELTSIPEQVSKPLFSSRFSFLILIGFVLSAFQQFTGINAVVYFTPKIFKEAGFENPQDAIFATILVGITNVIATFLTIFLIDRFGRRKLLLISQVGVIATLLLLVLSFATDWQIIDKIAVGAVILYIFSYSLGLGPIVWVLISEIFPLSVRAKALAFCTFVSWLSNYLIVLSFPSFISSFGPSWSFSIYAFLTFLAYLFCMRYIPETKGKTLEELERLLARVVKE
ncbi:MAG: sugar porter family MFS transporter [Parachlamydiales bacterium]|nr:sugar porter family MFS transporter [Parachlamydiales bacterium]